MSSDVVMSEPLATVLASVVPVIMVVGVVEMHQFDQKARVRWGRERQAYLDAVRAAATALQMDHQDMGPLLRRISEAHPAHTRRLRSRGSPRSYGIMPGYALMAMAWWVAFGLLMIVEMLMLAWLADPDHRNWDEVWLAGFSVTVVSISLALLLLTHGIQLSARRREALFEAAGDRQTFLRLRQMRREQEAREDPDRSRPRRILGRLSAWLGRDSL